MKISIAQLNSIVGDIEGNLDKVKNAISGLKTGTDLIVFPEMFLTGTVPKDLLKTPWFLRKTENALKYLVNFSADYPEPGIIIGLPVATRKKPDNGLYNSAVLLKGGRILFKQAKTMLSSYNVNDENRYFVSPRDIDTIKFKDEILGICVGEDILNISPPRNEKRSEVDPLAILAKKGATIFINISCFPYTIGGEATRLKILKRQVQNYGIPLIFVNAIGGEDELIFEGASLMLDREGRPVKILPPLREQIAEIDTSLPGLNNSYPCRDKIEILHEALVLGIRDYVKKCGFTRAVIGISGGIDSAVTCALAVRALGPDNVYGISMPSDYTSNESTRLALDLVENLAIHYISVPISPIFNSYVKELKEHITGDNEKEELAWENIQARVRGNILMAFSNRYGSIVLSTGNKSESATGYCTLYGDLTGGLAVIADVYKTTVYELAEYINRENELIPRGIIERAPSAELKPDQTDQDVLPPYPLLDFILRQYLENDKSAEEIEDMGIDPDVIDWVLRAITRNEYKRRQAPPGLKVTGKAFGIGRQMPIAAKINHWSLKI